MTDPYRRLQDALDALDAAFAPLSMPYRPSECLAPIPDPRIYLTALDRLGAEPAA